MGAPGSLTSKKRVGQARSPDAAIRAGVLGHGISHDAVLCYNSTRDRPSNRATAQERVARMSTVSTIHAPEQPAAGQPDDPFRYGWRYVRVQQPDGTETSDQIPLTLEDVLHPETGDFIVQTDPHDNDSAYLKYVFKSRLANDPHAAVISDCRVDWNLSGIKPLGPDVAVFFDVMHHRLWATLNVAAERVTTALVVEVTSPATRTNDVEIKFDYYQRPGACVRDRRRTARNSR